MLLDEESIRRDFPILNRTIQGRRLIYFDNAASTLKPIQVIEAIVDFYKNHYANVHRGLHTLSQEASQMYEEAHEILAKFINAYSWDEIVFVNNTTEGLNLVAYAWGLYNINEGDEIVLTVMDHHSSMLPWRHIAKLRKAKVKYIKVANDGYLDYNQLDNVITEKTKVVAFPIASNVLGTICDVKKIVKKAKEVRALVVADGAQSVPHIPTNVRELGVDFLAFSGHKMLGPTGSGVLWGRKDVLEDMKLFKVGGDTIKDVTLDNIVWLDPPWRFEAGTPNIEAAIGLATATQYLMKIGMENVRQHEVELVKYTLKRIFEVFSEEIKYYGPMNPEDKTGVVAFNIKNLHHHTVAKALDFFGIAVRSGMHCAHPLHYALKISYEEPPPAEIPKDVDERLKRFGCVRASFYIYNTRDEVDYFIGALTFITKVREELARKPVEAVCTGT
jgi:cysteine desulfurase/selenocysteine lyase